MRPRCAFIGPFARKGRRRVCCQRCRREWSFTSCWVMSTDKKTGGLAGVVAGQTAISTVGKEGMGLTYRGYSINDLAEKATFEEVAFLLIYGHLPNRTELDAYIKKLSSLRGLPAPLKAVLEQLPGQTHPMDVLRTGCSALGCLEPESPGRDQFQVANRLLAAF